MQVALDDLNGFRPGLCGADPHTGWQQLGDACLGKVVVLQV